MAAKALSNTCGGGRDRGAHPRHCKATDVTKDTHKTCYLNMEQSGQSGPHSPAQVTQQAVGERDDFPRTFPPTPAPLIHQPSIDWKPLFMLLPEALVDWRFTHRKNDSSRKSADAQPRPTEAQRLSASRDRQVEAEFTQNSTRPERTAAGFPPTRARPSMLGVLLGPAPRVLVRTRGRAGEGLSHDISLETGTSLYIDKHETSLEKEQKVEKGLFLMNLTVLEMRVVYQR